MEKEIAEVFLEFFDIYNNHFEKYADFLEIKQNKILLDDLKWLESALQEEQKYIMKGNSLEEKRLALFGRAGLGEITLEQLMELFPDELKGDMRLEADRLEKSIGKIKRLSAVSDSIVRRKLEVQAEILGVNDYTGIGTYDQNADAAKGTIGSDDIGSV